jgi:acyl-CoA thioester hydrolase
MKRIRFRIEPGWHRVEVQERVHFYDLDPMAVVWHGHYVRYLEVAREAWFASRGLSYHRLGELGLTAPVVRLQLEYLAPARGGELLTIALAAMPPDRCLLELVGEIRGADGGLRCIAESVQAFADAQGEIYRTVPPALAGFLDLPGIRPQ